MIDVGDNRDITDVGLCGDHVPVGLWGVGSLFLDS